MKKAKATFFNDPGHGWLGVKRSLLIDLGILNQVSAFSYQKGGMVYLEEDGDLALLAKTIKERHGLKLDEFFEIKDSYSERSPIRGYAPFNPKRVEKFEIGQVVFVYGKKHTVVHVSSPSKKYPVVKDERGCLYKLVGVARESVTLAQP